jgi:hypothetical protein
MMTYYLGTNFEKKKIGKCSISFHVLVKINFRVVGSPLWMVHFCMPYWILIWLFSYASKVHKYGKSTTGESWDIVVDEETYYE